LQKAITNVNELTKGASVFLLPKASQIMKQKLQLILSIILGAVFIISGVEKVANTAAFGNLITQWGFRWLHPLAPFIALAQVGVGLCLILGIRRQIMALATVAMLVGFSLAYTYAYFWRGVADCGCSEIITIGEGIWLFYLRNAVLLGISLFIGLYYSENQEKISETKNMVLLGVLLPMIFVAGFTYRLPTSFQHGGREYSLLHQHVKDTPLFQYLQTDPNKSYLVFFYSYTCPHGWNSIQNFKHFGQSQVVDSIVSFAFVGQYMSDMHIEIWSEFVRFFGDFGTQEILNDSEISQLIEFVPTTLYIRNDTIQKIMVGALQSPFTFQKIQKSNNQ